MSQTETLTSKSSDIAANRRCVSELGGGAIGVNFNDVRDTVVFITDASAGAYTLAAPTAGTDDGKTVKIVDKTGHAHTVTTPTNGINGNHKIATSAGGVGDDITFTAYQGTWYSNPTATSWTLSG